MRSAAGLRGYLRLGRGWWSADQLDETEHDQQHDGDDQRRHPRRQTPEDEHQRRDDDRGNPERMAVGEGPPADRPGAHARVLTAAAYPRESALERVAGTHGGDRRPTEECADRDD